MIHLSRGKAPSTRKQRASRAAGTAGAEREALFGPELPARAAGQSAVETRLRKELDEEINRSKKRGATTAMPHLGDLGPSGGTGVAPEEPAPEDGEAPEESSSEEEEIGFLGAGWQEG